MAQDKLSILEEIRKLVSGAEEPKSSVRSILELLARRFDLDLISVYLFDEPAQGLRLAATCGRKQSDVGEAFLSPGQGLTGLVLEQMHPVVVHDPCSHPRYEPMGEPPGLEHDVFIGLPLIYHQNMLGALVIQSRDAEKGLEEATPLFSGVASQVAATVAYSGLLDALPQGGGRKEAQESRTGPPAEPAGRNQGMLTGVPASEGIAMGRAHILVQSFGFDQIQPGEAEDPEAEAARFDEALRASEAELSELINRVEGLSEQDKAILEAHSMILQDKGFADRVKVSIKSGLSAEFALKSVVMEYMRFFSSLEDVYLRERGADLADIGERVLRHLLGAAKPSRTSFEVPTVVMASDMSPLEVQELRQPNVAGIVLTGGGRTSHAVILARSFELPMIIGAEEALDAVRSGDELILDGTSGLVFINPSRSVRQEYERLKREKRERFDRLQHLKDVQARSRDGRAFSVGANIGLLSDVELIHTYGADAVGLYRTELPFLARQGFPSEEEQTDLYSQVVEAAQGKTVTIRTLDLGGDKLFAAIDRPGEDNPALGWRAIRMTLELGHVLRDQVRAILRSSARGPVRLLLPLVSSVEEVKAVMQVVREEKEALRQEGRAFDPNLPLGVMVEVPAAVFILQSLVRCVDFVSIGTNDLTQYVLAVDRNNQKVGPLYNPLHPAVLALTRQAVATCRQAGCPVSVCGEAASRPKCARLILAMEPDALSLNPAAVPRIKDLIRRIDISEERRLLEQAMALEGPDAVSALMDRVDQGTALEIEAGAGEPGPLQPRAGIEEGP